MNLLCENNIKIDHSTKLQFNMNTNPKDKEFIEKLAQSKSKELFPFAF